MIRYISPLTAAALAILLPIAAHAYMNPYDVLLSDDLLLPSQPRTTIDRVERQQSESTARREREQEEIFAEQNPVVVEEVAPELEELHGAAAAPAELPITPEEREFNSLLRSLERIKENQAQAKYDSQVRQQAFLLLEEAGLHGGAPLHTGKGGRPLAPTGAGSVLAMAVMFLAGVWTLRRVRRSEKMTHAVS